MFLLVIGALPIFNDDDDDDDDDLRYTEAPCMRNLLVSLCASCGAVYCNRSCLWVRVFVCVFVGLLPR